MYYLFIQLLIEVLKQESLAGVIHSANKKDRKMKCSKQSKKNFKCNEKFLELILIVRFKVPYKGFILCCVK